MEEMDGFAVGLIRTPHGVKGDLRVRSLSGAVEHLLLLKEVFVKEGDRFLAYRVESVRRISRDILLKLEGIDNPEVGRTFSGLELWVSRQFANPLEAGEYYIGDLCRCSLYLYERKVGSVKSVLDCGWSDMLEVVSSAGETFLIPFIDHFIGEVDMASARISLKESSILP